MNGQRISKTLPSLQMNSSGQRQNGRGVIKMSNDKIPFDVEKWKSGKYDVVTRDDRKMLSCLVHEVECLYPVSVIFNDNVHRTYTLNGIFDTAMLTDNDLFLIPKKRKVWIAIRKEKLECDKFYVCSQAYDSKDQIPKESQCDAYHITEVELPDE